MKNKYLITIIVLFLLILHFRCEQSTYIRLNFHKSEYQSHYHIDNVFFAIMETDLSFGTPPYNISLQITTDSPYFVVKGSSPPDGYKQENSSSFYFIKYGVSYEYKKIYFHSIFFGEKFTFNNNETMNLDAMMYWGKHPISTNYGLIGLQLIDHKLHEDNSFINQLYDKKRIKDKVFSLIYENEFQGELIIGDYPHNKTKLLDGKKFKLCKNSFVANGAVYVITFDKIIFSEYTKFKNLKIEQKHYFGEISNTYYGYIGSKEYNYFINETFFKPKLITKSCWIQKIDEEKYFGYVCNKNVDTSGIPDVKFYHEGLNFTFEIKNEEMWKAYNNIKYFLIFFSAVDYHVWVLGQKFLEKYTFVFNGEKNLVGFYYTEEKIKKKSYIFLFLLLFFLASFIALYAYRKLYLNKKKNIEDGIELKEIPYQKA